MMTPQVRHRAALLAVLADGQQEERPTEHLQALQDAQQSQQDAQQDVRALRHAVANHLTRLVGPLDLLLVDYYGPLTPTQRGVVAAALEEAQQLSRAVHERPRR